MSVLERDVQDETTEDYLNWLQTSEGGFASDVKDMGDGFYAAVKPLMFHWTLILGEVGNKVNYLDRWCYETQEGAAAALKNWGGEGDPVGWNRHPNTGRRRPGGDPDKEYFAP